jgi:hypothetical protein
MSFEDEWADLKAQAAQRMGTRLNQLDGGGGGGSSPQGDLRVSQKDLAAIGNEAYSLYQALDHDGDHARVSSFEAANSLSKDFALGSALSHVATRWVDQKRSLLDACAHISNHLDYTKKAHQGDETYLATTISRISVLDQGFDERTQR